MYQFNFKEISDKDKKKIVQGSIVPRPIAWVTTENEAGVVNLAPFSFFQMLTKTLVGISFSRLDGKLKHTPTNLLKSGEGVIHIASQSLNEKLDLTSQLVGDNVSEVELAGLTLTESVKVKPKAIMEANIRLEVKVEQHVKLYDEKGNVEADFIILRVVYAHLDESVYDKESGYILVDRLDPLSRLAGHNYGKTLANGFKRKF